MGVITFKHSGNFKNTEKLLNNGSKLSLEKVIAPYGRRGVDALESATPTDTGITAGSWYYEIRKNKASFSLLFKNRHVNQGVPIVVLIQYGHATRTGGYVQGRDFINPALQPIFDQLVEDLWGEVKNL